MDQRKKALFALFTASIIWGAAPPIFKLSLQNIPPFTLAYLRFFIGAILLLPFCHKKLFIERKDLPTVILIGLFGITINISFFFLGLKYSDSINAAVLGAAAPIFTIIGSALLFREKTKANIISGALLSTVGVILIIIEPLLFKQGGNSLFGNVLYLGATLGAVGDTLFAKTIVKKYGAPIVTFWAFVTGTMTFIPLAIIETFKNPSWPLALDIRGYTGIVYGAVFSSFLAYLLWNIGLEKIPAPEVSIFYNLNPIVSVLIAVPLLGEKITIPFIFGSVLIFTGIALAERKIHLNPVRPHRGG